jgi:hypothetical protein
VTKRHSFAKTVSWAVVSFFVIYPCEVLLVMAVHGTGDLAPLLAGLALGTAVSCVAKSPAFYAHERAWHWWHGRRTAEEHPLFDAATDGRPAHTPSRVTRLQDVMCPRSTADPGVVLCAICEVNPVDGQSLVCYSCRHLRPTPRLA